MSGPLNVIGQFSHDVIGCKTRVKFVNSRDHWSVLIRLLFFGLFVVCFVYVVNKSFVNVPVVVDTVLRGVCSKLVN